MIERGGGGHSVRYKRGDISKGFLESILGETFDLDVITVTCTENDSFQNEKNEDNSLYLVQAIN